MYLSAVYRNDEVAIRDQSGRIIELFGAPSREQAESRLRNLGYYNESGWFDSADGACAWVKPLTDIRELPSQAHRIVLAQCMAAATTPDLFDSTDPNQIASAVIGRLRVNFSG